MMLKQLVLAATAAAFVIVPEISEKDESIFKALPVEPETLQLPPEALGQSLDVPCRQCRGRDAHLRLDFAVEDGSRLMVNGFELYPHADPWRDDLVAEVVRAGGAAAGERTLGYSLAVLPRAKDEEQQLELVDVRLRVIEVGHRFVDDMPMVKVGLIKAPTGEIVIADMQLMAVPEMPCHSMWCRAKSALKGFGGCHKNKMHHKGGRPHHGPAASAKDGEEGHHPHHHEHEHEHEHKPHRHQRPHHAPEEEWNSQRDWRQLVLSVASHIVLPVLMGITAGVGVAFFAMFLCSVVYRLSMLVRGGAPRRSWCPHHRRNASRFPSAHEEKMGLLEAEEAQDTTPAPTSEDEVVKN
ncbi:hypothetical protein BBK36DRAFT_1167601 [Trichoderma citrinoviride]|uniref:DUF7728 domain-containing protein n=1 Tax=Trichoderma citrinoviride TaxID=58853 RepID=A0A2T4BGC5_9HYPO|nr:hypothetical protein BBK36DRAFT_1167601 [Trichoderma citrinoviride]PTB68352.1 hypothetical protein BBK36DRAFT_1167601 [Trichoderma citrinoviride]